MTNSFSQRHSYHFVDFSPWPLLSSIGALGITSGLIFFFYLGECHIFFISLILLLLVVSLWAFDINFEGLFEGAHTKKVVRGFSYGVLLFILSEVMFFFGFFWSYFYYSFNPSFALGGVWPPKYLDVPDAFKIPALNTLLLVSSGLTITWAHYAITSKNKAEAISGLLVTILLAIIFTSYQLFEYTSAIFCISDGVYGSIFYLATGFHGFHVLVGTILLVLAKVRLQNDELLYNHHFGFEAAAWYWHFVDVVWIFLYLSFYIWGSIL